MSNIGTPIASGSIPAVGTSGTTYASQINLFLTEVKARLEALVPKSSLAAGALDMNGSAVQNSGYLGLADAGATPTSPTNSFQMHNGEVYWVSPAGVVQITTSGTLNAGSIGGITGDYGGVNPAKFRFVDADQEYYAYDDFGAGAWAYLWARGVDLAKNSTSATRTRVIASSAMGSNYTLTLPPAPAGTDALVQMSNTGVTTASNTLSTSIVATDFRHSVARTLSIPAATWRDPASSHGIPGFSVTLAASANTLYMPITLPVGSHITSIVTYVQKTTAGTDTIGTTIYKTVGTTGVNTVMDSTSNNANNPGFITLTLSPNITIAAGEEYTIVFTPGGATAANHRLFHSEVIYTRP